MALFDNIKSGLQKFTALGRLGLFDDSSVNYSDLFQSQLAIYNQQIAERNRLAGAADVMGSNLASSTILTGGSKPIATGALSNDFSTRIAADAAVRGTVDPVAQAASLEGLTGDSLALQQERNRQATEDFIKSLRIESIPTSLRF